MLIRLKLVLAVTLAVAGVVALDGVYDFLRERALVERSARDEVLRRSRLLSPMIRDAYAAGGEALAKARIAELHAKEPWLRVDWVPLASVDASPMSAQEKERLRRGEPSVSLEDGTTQRLYSLMSLPDGTARVLRVTQRIDHLPTLRHAALTSLLESIVVILLCAFATAGICHWLVTGPILRLTGIAERIGSGDFDAAEPLAQHDEIGTLSRTMQLMSKRLRKAREDFAEEHEAHLATLEALRHTERLSTVGRLASTVAHELGTPLNVVAVRAQMVANGKDVQENARIIREQAERMTKIIRDILGVARRDSPRLEAVDLLAVIRKAHSLSDHVARRRNVRQEIHPESEPLIAHGHSQQMLQVVLNMMINAIQATPSGGVVSVRTHRQASTEHPNAMLADIEITDNGAGIPDTVLPRIFEPFYTTKGPAEGTGLGLSVAYGIVKDWGGWIDVRSELGRGSCFTIHLPMEPLSCEAAS